MNPVEFIKKAVKYLEVRITQSRAKYLSDFVFKDDEDIADDIKRKYNTNTELVDIYTSIETGLIDKWHHYIPLYDRYLSKFKGTKVKFLEIGVSQGGSLEMWRRYLGNEAIIYGIDIDERCSKFNGKHAEVRIGSQDDELFLKSIIEEMGGVDVIIDDGSHIMKHIKSSLQILYPHLTYGGLYIVEDLHTSFWNCYGGGYRSKNNFFVFLQQIIYDIHHWYHFVPRKLKQISDSCVGIHVHDSMVILEKNTVFKPTSSKVGTEYFSI